MRELRRLNAWLNGASLKDADGRIIIKRIIEDAPEVDTTYGAVPGGHGQRFIFQSRKSRRISIVFSIRELYDVTARTRTVDAVNAWARDPGYLEISSRPDQRIWVRRANAAAAGDVRDYTAELQLDFDAYASPFWEDVGETSVSLTGPQAEGTLSVIGSAPPLIRVDATARAALTSLTVTVGDTSMALEGLTLESGQKLSIDHDPEGWLTITANGQSAMSARTAASSDELTASAGAVAVSVQADAACDVIIRARGRWL